MFQSVSAMQRPLIFPFCFRVLGRVALLALFVLPLRAEADSAVERVSFTARADGKGYVVRIHLTGKVTANSVDQPSPTEVRLTLYQAGLAPDLRRDDARGPVQRYTVNPADDRIVLAFEIDPNTPVQVTAYPDRDSNDILMNVAYAAPVLANGGVRPDAASNEHWKLDCIVIDAGHGGHDGGAAANGVREKDITLGVARKLGGYVQDQLGMRVVYTRADDRFIELHERGRIANESCGKLFVSIHANAAGSRSASGSETYFLGLHKSKSARDVMERENSVVALESEPGLYAGFDDASIIVQTMATTAYQRAGERLAELIQDQFEHRADRHSRGVKQAGFLVLWRASMPAVLVELGFVTNKEEARFLRSDSGQDLMASAIFRSIRDYKEQYERGLSLALN